MAASQNLPGKPRKSPPRRPPAQADGISIKLEIKVAGGTIRSMLDSTMQAALLYMRYLGLL